MTTDSFSQSMLAAGFAWTLHLILWSLSTLANCSWGASSHVMPTSDNNQGEESNEINSRKIETETEASRFMLPA